MTIFGIATFIGIIGFIVLIAAIYDIFNTKSKCPICSWPIMIPASIIGIIISALLFAIPRTIRAEENSMTAYLMEAKLIQSSWQNIFDHDTSTEPRVKLTFLSEQNEYYSMELNLSEIEDIAAFDEIQELIEQQFTIQETTYYTKHKWIAGGEIRITDWPFNFAPTSEYGLREDKSWGFMAMN